jgi:hypothetical protein
MVTSRRLAREPLVLRRYEPREQACARALELLVKSAKSKEGGPAITAPDDAMKGSNDDRARVIIPKHP